MKKDRIEIKAFKKGKPVNQVFEKANTRVSWTGLTGRSYDFFYWFNIKDHEKECYITLKTRRTGLKRGDALRYDASRFFDTFRSAGYYVSLDMPAFDRRRFITYSLALVVPGMAVYVFTADEITSKSGVLSGTAQFLFGCLVLAAAFLTAGAGYFACRNQPPLTEEEPAGLSISKKDQAMKN